MQAGVGQPHESRGEPCRVQRASLVEKLHCQKTKACTAHKRPDRLSWLGGTANCDMVAGAHHVCRPALLHFSAFTGLARRSVRLRLIVRAAAKPMPLARRARTQLLAWCNACNIPKRQVPPTTLHAVCSKIPPSLAIFCPRSLSRPLCLPAPLSKCL